MKILRRVLHNYAETIATAMEEEVIQDSAHIDDAIDHIKKSISLAPKYAKYYCTYGRLLALKSQIAKGLQLIRKAIDLEDSQKSDYAIRIGDYQAYHSKLIFMQHTTRNLEFLGFFAALVSFIIASIQILGKQPFEEATQLIIVLNGCLLCAFAGFFALIHEKNYFFRISYSFPIRICNDNICTIAIA